VRKYDFEDPVTARIAGFLNEIGLDVRPRETAESTFLPGITVENGVMWVDESKLERPGDLLHEGGHLALKSPAERREIHGNMGADGGEEMGAIAWSYAALCHLQLDSQVVFHDHGCRGGAQALVDNFAAGRYIGTPILQWRGLAVEGRSAQDSTTTPYPHMIKWLRTE
jgi:hypothetical protein